ncbi:MAG: hypothetical protein AABZ53_10640 [Planctomycetota bacterium]
MNAFPAAFALTLALGTTAALADFTISPPLMHSAGAFGNAGNSVYLYTYTGPDAVVTGGEFVGAISSIIRGTTMGEARWNLRNTRFGTTGTVSFQPINLGYFENSVLVLGYPGGGMIVKTGDVIRIETHESSSAADDGPGTDAVWSDVSWTFETAAIESLGNFESVSSIQTSGGEGFGTDTEIAMFNSDGLLLRSNDDFAGTSGSGFSGLTLADGTYYLAVVPYNATFANGLVRPGFDGTGDFTLAFNGAAVDSATLAAYSTLWYSFTVGTPPTCPADFDGDGTADFFDYDAFVTCFEGGSCPSGKTADFDGDGTVDFFDYDAFVAEFESGC